MLETIWGLIVLVSVLWVIYDVFNNQKLSNAMKAVWVIVVLLFGIFGAIVYYFVGRK
jgi:ABC-type long-subunit fatty acid transport system fused permease/ATPase subunit